MNGIGGHKYIIPKANDGMKYQISEIENKLDDRAFNRILRNPLTYLVAITILLIGVLVGVWGCRWVAR